MLNFQMYCDLLNFALLVSYNVDVDLSLSCDLVNHLHALVGDLRVRDVVTELVVLEVDGGFEKVASSGVDESLVAAHEDWPFSFMELHVVEVEWVVESAVSAGASVVVAHGLDRWEENEK